jgi:DNA-binding NtrC family response regulator
VQIVILKSSSLRHPHYTIEAIRISAFDYLMKPIAIKELQQAIERLRNENRLSREGKIQV